MEIMGPKIGWNAKLSSFVFIVQIMGMYQSILWKRVM